ncbi:hypothetical protein EZV62_018144 [Acer yangbiense]|uniref:Transposase MuDR plant domain-containing protein n=1 Tax=Acer yangbiense TaxID=1000413 RepID=A0A5C7HIK2_9ROSI|nr:hypothetical protein EZV62_018144 [Acer yangbiense]
MCNGKFHFQNFVQTGVNLVEVGKCDVDHISLITLIHAICEKLSGSSDVPTGDYHVWAQIPWSGDKYKVGSDSELLELFSMFEERGLDKIAFELEDYFYIPTPPEEPQVLDVEGGYKPLGWCDMEAEQLNYESDSEKDDDRYDEDCDEDNTQFREVPIVEEESVDGDDGVTQDCMDGFEGYQSKFDDQCFTDSELELEQVRIARLVKGNPFKRMVDGIISFHIGHIFNSKEHMRDVFKEYVIQEKVELKRVKNDRVRQTYECTGDRCGWRAHGSCMIDGVTFMIKTLLGHHNFHRVYNNKEAKVKWIAFKFEKLVKSNPSIDVKVIGDLLRESYKVSVDMHKLYRAKHKALKELVKEHENCFGYLRRCDHVTNNMIEAFNSMLGTHRAKSYLDLLKFIRRMVMRKFKEINDKCRGWSSVLPPRVHAKILRHGRESRSLTMIAVGNMEYELLGASGGYAVKLREYNC